MYTRIVIALVAAAVGCAAADRAALRSGEFAITLDKTTARVVSLADNRANVELQSASSHRGLFTVGLSRPRTGEHREIPASAFRQVKLEAGPSELTVRFSDAADAPLTVTCRFTVRHDSPLIFATVKVENHSDWAIPWVDFPSIVLNPQIGDSGDDDVLLIPTLGGEMFKNPSKEPVHVTAETLTMQYPGYASYQMLAFFDDRAGLYLATYDTRGNVKSYRAEMKADGLDLTPRHLGPEVIGDGFETDYPTVLGATRGPWYNAADRYKEWAVKQFWCRTTLAERKDVPDWLKTGPPFLLVYPEAEPLDAVVNKDRPDKLLDLIDHYRSVAGTPQIMYTSGEWAHQGVWLGPYYFPPQPSEDWWKDFCAKAHKRNIHVSLMTSGYKWTIRQNVPYGAPAFDYTEDFKRRSGMAITKPDGTPMLVGNPDIPAFMGGTRSRICRGSKEGQDLMADVFAGIARMGAEMSSFDQDIGGGERIACYNPAHNHPPGFGKWMWETYRDLNIRILKETRAYVPQFVLYQEDAGELTIPWQATTWARDFRILDHEHYNAWGVPVFRYLYHEYEASIGAALFHGSGFNPAPATRVYAMARCLAYGLNQGEFATEILLNGEGKPESLTSRAYFAYSRALSAHSDFLILGKMLRPMELTCATTRLPFRRKKNPASPVQDDPLDLPAVVQGAYQAPDGRVGVILVNATDTRQTATLKFPRTGGLRKITLAPLEAVFLE